MVSFYSFLKDPQTIEHLKALDVERAIQLSWKPFISIKEWLTRLPNLSAPYMGVKNGAVILGPDLPEEDLVRQAAQAAAESIRPWKKGPFRLFGIGIDAEWRSDLKWERMAGYLPSFKGQLVLDVGCNNGYYMFRILEGQPRFVLGIDPVPRLWYQFHLLQHFARCSELEFHMWGWRELSCWPNLFDSIFCMGIIYHHPNPIEIMQLLYLALKPGGLLVLESIIIPGEGSLCLFPQDRYAKMRNVWFVPTQTALKNFLKRTKFIDVQIIATNKHEPHEQRATFWNPGPSYESFIQNQNLTVEGHPAPHRAILTARKRLS